MSVPLGTDGGRVSARNWTMADWKKYQKSQKALIGLRGKEGKALKKTFSAPPKVVDTRKKDGSALPSNLKKTMADYYKRK